MAKFLRPGKVVILLKGRFAGKKAVIVKNLFVSLDEGDTARGRNFACALVVGIERGPLSVDRSMSQKKIERRLRIKPFIKVVGYNHVMPTRYSFDGEFNSSITPETIKDPSVKKDLKNEAVKVLQEKYKSGRNKWFFTKLKF